LGQNGARWLFGSGKYIYFRTSVYALGVLSWRLYIFDDQGLLPLEHRDLEIFERRRHKKEQVDD
jgi:hypothetical protein